MRAVDAANEVGRLFADHDRGRVGIAAGYRGHDRGVGDAQIFDSIDAQLRIERRAASMKASVSGFGSVMRDTVSGPPTP